MKIEREVIINLFERVFVGYSKKKINNVYEMLDSEQNGFLVF